MTAAYNFVLELDTLEVPLFTASPATDREFNRPACWQRLTADGNRGRLEAYRDGDAISGVMGGQVAAVDVDVRNGGDVDKVRHLLAGLDITIFAEVATPGGGCHFYIAGHPDLPTVHATADRPGLIGYPGVEIISFGANVFLPGTKRPKYDGRGYDVVFNNLAALADGGDPDGAETFAAWAAEHRATTTSDGPVSPPWDGKPSDARQAAYLAATIHNLHDRVAGMAPDSGRNTALFNAAMCSGNFIAGAGMDEAAAVRELEAAAEACGLTADDGLRSVQATIASGLKNGLSRPKAVPDAVGDPAGAESPSAGRPLPTDSSAAPIPLAEAHNVFTRWLGVEYDLDALDAMLATAAVERIDGDPLWLLLVSGSGNAKTETVQSLDGIGATVTSTISSPGALLSGTPSKDKAKDATGGLLRKIGARGVLVVKDVTSILSMSGDSRGEVLAALREVHDGRWERNLGTDGGRTLEWRGRIAVVGAVTTAWDRAHNVVSMMGDRFVLLRMDSSTGRQDAGRRAIGNVGSEEQMRAELAAAVAGVLAGIDPTAAITVTRAESDRLLAAADLVTRARTAVDFDYRGEVVDAHAPEMPTRFAKELTQVVRGGVAVGMDRHDALRLAVRCARDSMPPLRLMILDDLAANPGAATREVRKRLGKPRATIDRQLQALHMLEVLAVDELDEQWGGRSTTVWRYRIADGIDPAALDPESLPVPLPDSAAHAHRHTEKRAETDPDTRSYAVGAAESGKATGTAPGDVDTDALPAFYTLLKNRRGINSCSCGAHIPDRHRMCAPCAAAMQMDVRASL